ncbi:hypothetical protein BV22DRAFT_979405, partial [Leucogyrophana mollusca]
GILISCCSVEIMQKICDLLCAADLVIYGATAKKNYLALHDYLGSKRLHDTIRVFMSDPASFISMMRTHGCAISGSLALYFFNPTLEWAP